MIRKLTLAEEAMIVFNLPPLDSSFKWYGWFFVFIDKKSSIALDVLSPANSARKINESGQFIEDQSS